MNSCVDLGKFQTISQTVMFGLSLKCVLPQAPCSLILNLYESLGKLNPYVSHSFTLTSSKYSLKESLDVLNSWNHIFLPSLGCCLSCGQHLKGRKYVRPFGEWWGPQLRLLLPLGHSEKSSKCGLCFITALQSAKRNHHVQPLERDVILSRKWKIQNQESNMSPGPPLFTDPILLFVTRSASAPYILFLANEKSNFKIFLLHCLEKHETFLSCPN